MPNLKSDRQVFVSMIIVNKWAKIKASPHTRARQRPKLAPSPHRWRRRASPRDPPGGQHSDNLHQPNQDPAASVTTEEPSNFSPGPYIIGSLVPRCFDTSRRVQSTALACLQLLVSLLQIFFIST